MNAEELCQTLRRDMQIIAAETMHTYDLKTFAIAKSNSSTLLKIPPTCNNASLSALHS